MKLGSYMGNGYSGYTRYPDFYVITLEINDLVQGTLQNCKILP